MISEGQGLGYVVSSRLQETVSNEKVKVLPTLLSSVRFVFLVAMYLEPALGMPRPEFG